MKVKDIQSIFGSYPEIVEAITGSKEPQSEVSEKVFAENLYKNAPAPERDLYLRLYIDCLQKQNGTPHEKTAARIFLDKFMKEPKPEGYTFSPALTQMIQKAEETFAKYTKGKESATPKEKETAIVEFGKFPETVTPLSKFKEIAALPEIAKQWEEEVSKHAKADPSMCAKRQARDAIHEKGFSYDVVQLGKSPTMVLSGTPRSHWDDCVNKFYKMIIDEKVQKVVALNTFSDWDKAIPYYTDEQLSALNIGWSVKCESMQVHYESQEATNIPKKRADTFAHVDKTDEKLAPYRLRVEERTLLFSKDSEERRVSHYHIVNWPDHKEIPHLEALDTLFQKLETAGSDDQRIAIHCQGGIGRTAAFALMYWLVKEVEAQKGEDAAYNVPEMFYQLKLLAPRLGGGANGERFAQIYAIASQHYEKIRK